MKDKRPKNLNMFTIRFPVPAIVSILHRISGLILFLLIPFLLWTLRSSLNSQQDFEGLQSVLSLPWVKFILWGCLSAFIFHFVAGTRHLLMDIHIGEGLNSGRYAAILTIIISLVLVLATGAWLW